MTPLSKFLTWLYPLFLVLLAVLWWGRLPDYSDAVLYAYPDRWVNLDAFRQGFIPLWNSTIGCGTPHLANWVSSCLYPPFWVLNFTGLTAGFMPMTLAHAGLAYFGFFLWLRSRKVAPLFCALGALAFASSGHLTRCWTNISFITTAAWIPWIFWAAQRAVEKPLFGRWLALGTVLSLQVLAGYPFFTFYTILFLILWFELQRPSRDGRLSFWGTLMGSALFTSVQWLPFLDFLSWSFHDTWTDYPYFTKPVEYLTLLKPDILGTPGHSDYRGSFSNANFNLYIGILPLFLLVLSAFKFSRTKNKFWVLSSFFWLLWLAGGHFPLWKIIPRSWLEFVEPSKAVGLFVFCAATAAAMVLNSFFREKRRPTLAWAWLLAVLWALDLLSVPLRLIHPLPDPYRDAGLWKQADQAVQLAKRKRMLSLQTAGGLSQAAPGEDAFTAPVRMLLANSNSVWGLRSADKYLFLQVDGSQNLTRYINKGFPYEGDLLDIAGVSLLRMPQVLSPAKYRVIGMLEDDFLMLNSSASKDMWFVTGMVEWPDRPSVLDTMARPGSGWREKAYLEKKPEGGWIGLAPAKRTPPPPSRIFVPDGYHRESAGHALFARMCALEPSGSTRGNSPTRFAVFNETYAPGWKAWVGGEPKPILRAYGLFMAVPVNDDNNWVEFRYEPVSFRLGLFLALVVFSCALAAFLWNRSSRIQPQFK